MDEILEEADVIREIIDPPIAHLKNTHITRRTNKAIGIITKGKKKLEPLIGRRVGRLELRTNDKSYRFSGATIKYIDKTSKEIKIVGQKLRVSELTPSLRIR